MDFSSCNIKQKYSFPVTQTSLSRKVSKAKDTARIPRRNTLRFDEPLSRVGIVLADLSRRGHVPRFHTSDKIVSYLVFS